MIVAWSSAIFISSTAGLLGSRTESSRRNTVIGKITSRYFAPDVEVAQNVIRDAPDEVGNPAEMRLVHGPPNGTAGILHV